MFKITVFGTGSRGNSALVSDGETNILIDAGVKLYIVQQKIAICNIKAVLISHGHGDHTEYLEKLSSFYNKEVYATEGTIREIVNAHIYTYLRNIIEYGKPFTVGTLTITPFPLSHDAAEPCGFFIRNELNETIVWASDTGTMDGLQMGEPADCYVLEANYDEQDIDERLENGDLPYEGLHGRLTSEYGHLSIQQAAWWLKENADKDSWIIILSPHPEVVVHNMILFREFDNMRFSGTFPVSYEFGKKCPF